MWIMCNEYQVLSIIVLIGTYDVMKCDPISNTNFNSHIRDYASADRSNITKVKTLQKEELRRYETFAPAGNPVTFKEIPDSALSSSSNSRGLYHDQPGYALNDYEEGPHYSHGHDYHLYDAHPEVHVPHAYDHDHHDSHDPHDHHNHHDHHSHDHHHYSGHHHIDHGHYKHYKHALAAKTVLWPIAGIALLGAAAALVSNPVLLQLGVVSGKRRRRDTEEITEPDLTSDTFIKYTQNIRKQNDDKHFQHENIRKTKTPKHLNVNQPNDNNLKRRVLSKDNVKDNRPIVAIKKIRSSSKRNVEQVTYPHNYDNYNDDDKFIPIPIQLRTPSESK